MGYLNCRCGNRISDVVQPNEREGLLLSSYAAEYEAPADALVNAKSVFECNDCGALILDVGNGILRHYASPDGKPIELFPFRPSSSTDNAAP